MQFVSTYFLKVKNGNANKAKTLQQIMENLAEIINKRFVSNANDIRTI